MRHILRTLLLLLALVGAAAGQAQAGEIVDGTTKELIEDILRDLGDAKIVGRVGSKIGKNVVGRGPSGTLQTLLTSSDKVICGFWQAQGHAMMNDLTIKRVPAKTYAKAQRLKEIIDRNCDRVINPEAYRVGGGGKGGAREEEEDEEEEEQEEGSGSGAPLDPEARCKDRCLSEYMDWRTRERDVKDWHVWVKRRQAQLKAAGAKNARAARESRAADRRAKAAEARARDEKSAAQKAGWPAGSGAQVGTAIQDAKGARDAAEGAKAAWRRAYAAKKAAKANVTRAKNALERAKTWAARARAIYEACLKRCKDEISDESSRSAMLETLQRFEAEEAARESQAGYVAYPTAPPIYSTPGTREGFLQRFEAPMGSGYGAHVSGWGHAPSDPYAEPGDPYGGEPIAHDPGYGHDPGYRGGEMNRVDAPELVVEGGARDM